jgi:aspartate-semialdehyde dehydrogenase
MIDFPRSRGASQASEHELGASRPPAGIAKRCRDAQALLRLRLRSLGSRADAGQAQNVSSEYTTNYTAPDTLRRIYNRACTGNPATKCNAMTRWQSGRFADPEVPLVVPECNPEAAQSRPKGIIANPNCSTIQMVVALKPLHVAARVKHIVVSTYQATSGKGHAAVEELRAQIAEIGAGQQPTVKVFPGQMAMNVMSDWKPGQHGYSEEELKMVNETRKILGDPEIGVTPTCVRVPVVTGHSESVHVQFHRPMKASEAIALLRGAPGVVLVEGEYAPGKEPQPLQAADTDPVYVGRVRDDLAVPGAINLWVVADNLRKGAALNAVQIAEIL